jgi:SH3-like domain-containing protein
MVDLRRAIDEHGLPVEVVQNNGQEMLVFDPDPSRRWILLKLLDDDYLNSVMTHLRYEVNSKITRPAAAY